MATPSEQFEPGKNPKQDAVQALRNQLDQLEKRGGGDARVVEAVRNTRSRLDNLQKSLNDVHELERTALRMQAELNQTTEDNAKLKESLPADVIKKLENAARVEVSPQKSTVNQPPVTINTNPVPQKATVPPEPTPARAVEKSPDTALRVKLGGVLSIDGKDYTFPPNGTVYMRRNFSAVRQGNEWVVTKRNIEAKPNTIASVVQPKVTINTNPVPQKAPVPPEPTPTRTVEKSPDTALRVKLGGVLNIDGKSYTFPPDGTVYMRRNFSAVRQGNEWVVTKRNIEARPLTQNKLKPAPIPSGTLKVTPRSPTTSPTPRSTPTNNGPVLTPISKRPIERKAGESVQTSIPQTAERGNVVVPTIESLNNPIEVPAALRERFNAVDRSYRDTYAKITDPSFRFADEENISSVHGPERDVLEREVEDVKKQMTDELLMEWKRARDAFAKAPASSKAPSSAPLAKLPPELLDVWAVKYKGAQNDKERAQMFIEDAAIQNAPLLTASQLEAVIGSRILAKRISGPDGVFGTKDDYDGRVVGKRTVKDSFLGRGSVSTHRTDPLEDQFIRYLMRLENISAESRVVTRELGKKIGKDIKVEPVNGFNTAVLDWMIEAQNSPTSKTGMPYGMEVTFTDAPTSDPSVQLASISKQTALPAEEKMWAPSVEKSRSWQEYARTLVTEDTRLKNAYESHEKTDVRVLYEKLRSTVGQCWKVYTECVNQKPVDELLVQASLQEIERTMHYYSVELANLAKGTSGASKSSAVEDLADSADGQMARMLFRRGQSPEQINTALTAISRLKPFRKLTDEQVYSLLYLKAHLPALAGSDGKLNRNDIDALVSGISKDVIEHPDELYKQIIAREKIDVTTPEGKEKAVGIAYALGLPEKNKGDYDRIKKGVSYAGSSWTSWTVSKADKQKLQKLGTLVQNDILPGVQKDVKAEVTGFMESAGLNPSTGNDSGHGTITQSDMLALEKHARVLQSISGNSLKPVMDATGAKIETRSPNGLSTADIEWMLDAHARPQGRVGMPPGTVLRINQKTMPSPTPTPSIATEPETIVPAKQETAQQTNDQRVSATDVPKGAKGITMKKETIPPPPAEEELIPIAESSDAVVDQPSSFVQASIAPETEVLLPEDIIVDKQSREIRLPNNNTFRIDYNPNPSNLPATTFTPDKTSFYDGIAMNVRRDATNWIVTVKPGFEKFVVVTRDADKASVRLAEPTVADAASAKPNNSPEVLQGNIVVIKSEADFQREIRESKVPVVVDFMASWCDPCRRMHPHLEKIAKEQNGSVKILQVDVDALPVVAANHKLSLYPTLVVYQNGKQTGKNHVGYKDKAGIEKLIPPAEKIASKN